MMIGIDEWGDATRISQTGAPAKDGTELPKLENVRRFDGSRLHDWRWLGSSWVYSWSSDVVVVGALRCCAGRYSCGDTLI